MAAQGNISQVKVEEPDLEAYPLFAQARFEEVILAPGDVLFIPKVRRFILHRQLPWRLTDYFCANCRTTGTTCGL